MKNLGKVYALLLIFLLAFVFPTAVFAGNHGNNKHSAASVLSTTDTEAESDVDSDEVGEIDEDATEADEDATEADEDATEVDEDATEVDEDGDEVNEGKGKGPKKEWIIQKKALIQTKAAIAENKEAAEAELEGLEQQYEDALAAGDTVLSDELAEKITTLKTEITGYKTEMKATIEAMHNVKVFNKEGEVEFDVPPVIKEGRLLIPLRAISAAAGADVVYDHESKTITINQDDNTISMVIGEKFLTLNGEKVEIDVPATILENRTVIPLRMIVENLDLDVEWDAETQTVEIN